MITPFLPTWVGVACFIFGLGAHYGRIVGVVSDVYILRDKEQFHSGEKVWEREGASVVIASRYSMNYFMWSPIFVECIEVVKFFFRVDATNVAFCTSIDQKPLACAYTLVPPKVFLTTTVASHR